MDTIIFKIQLKKELGGFAAVSNFIGKMCAGIEVTPEEVRGISSLLCKDEKKINLNDAVKICCENKKKFRDVNRPQNIIEGIKGFHIAYCIYMDDESVEDVVEWQYYVLIKKFYKNIAIAAVMETSVNMYFKVSHYLHELSLTDQEFYDSVYFYEANRLSRLQKENVNKTKDFVPLIYINNNSMLLLKRPLREILGIKIISTCITKQLDLEKVKCTPYLKGCLDWLMSFSDFIDTEKIDEFISRLSEGSLLSFILFTYSFNGCLKRGHNRKNKLDIFKVHKFYQQVDECSAGCLQLIENVVMHAATGTGVLSIRFHSNRSSYLREKYMGDIQPIPHLEVLITDYAGGLKSVNIAEDFRNNIHIEELRELFRDVFPVDFIQNSKSSVAHKEIVSKAFAKYYSYSEHIGKHYGLKIFQNILQHNQGIFSFYSHSSGQCMPGESWNFKENSAGNKYAQCMPGTSFSILFPLQIRNKQLSKEQIGVEELYIPQKRWRDYIKDYKCTSCEIEMPQTINSSQNEKEKEIQKLSRRLTEKVELTDKNILYIAAENLNSTHAEYFCKAMLIAGYGKMVPDFVLYQCKSEFVSAFLETMITYFKMGTLNYAFKENPFCIALFTKREIKELLLYPHSIERTIIANKLVGFSGNDILEDKWIAHRCSEISVVDKKLKVDIPPYDVMHKIEINGREQTIFEAYALQILETNIQEKAFGCKITDTHMRLGSTIHIDSFYEAELLYSSHFFVSRFAYLLALEISKEEQFKKASEITLYSYALYSELFIVKTISILNELFPDKSIDYAILEREAEHREFKHVDRIRYARHFATEEERKNYFSTRKVICIVPINSTLKTHEKLNDMFYKENTACTPDSIIMNYAVILVGSKESNRYWTIDEKNKTFTTVNLKIKPIPRYFIVVKVSYQEASECKMCFPRNPLLEKPLIEVNAASTIPDQSFGLYGSPYEKTPISWKWILEEEEKLKVLKQSLVYSHIKRGENHFSMYFRTDTLFIENKEEIIQWLKSVRKELHMDFRENHILVCPSHFSNAGFLEYVNKIIFDDSALIVRLDVDKEYRCNIETKYSYLRSFMEMLAQRSEKTVVRVYYVDDNIISGRTFQRMNSLISSVLGIYINEYQQLDIRLFDQIFVLLDRNSLQTRMQYLESGSNGNSLIEKQQHRFWAFRTLNISSMRNHGDSCVLCQLAKRDRILYRASATPLMASHWKTEAENHEVRILSDSENGFIKPKKCVKGKSVEKKEKQDRAFRRMVCMHVSGSVLSERYHGNKKEIAMQLILTLLLEDYNGRKKKSQEEAFEYLISYFKVIARPFIAFSKVVRESVFDIILVSLEYLLTGNKNVLSNEVLNAKPYLIKSQMLFERLYTEIIKSLKDLSQKRDLLLVLMNQCMELRGNYFIRSENVQKLLTFIADYSEEERGEIYYKYLCLTKNLVGVNSDTSKSAWYNTSLNNKTTSKGLKFPEEIYTLLYIENTRAYYDGIKRLSESEEISGKFLDVELTKYHYRDFKLVVQQYGWIDNGTRKLTEMGVVSLKAAIELVQCIRSFHSQEFNNCKKRDVRSICKSIVDYISNMVQAESVYLVLELPMECECWEDELKNKFNEMFPDLEKNMYYKLENKKEYMVIAGKNGKSDKADFFEIEKQCKIKKFHEDIFASKCGFKIDEEDHCLIWEIGQEGHHPLLFYIEFQKRNSEEYLKWTRNVMANNYFFSEYVFTGRIRENLYELMLAEKERLVYNIDKIECHTETDIKNRQYSDVQDMKENKQEFYRSYSLTLLKDLQVSDVYRPSLHRKYYCRVLKIGDYTWEKTPIEFDKDSSEFIVVGTSHYNYIKVVVHTNKIHISGDDPLRSEDSLIAFRRTDGVSTPFLLILALIMNAAVEGRAKIVRYDEETPTVDVYLSCTSTGNLRILNISGGENKDLDKIRQDLEYPPGRDAGISMWSMSRYIKSLVSTLADNCIKGYAKRMCTYTVEEKSLYMEKLKEKLDRLFSDEYQIQVEYEKDKNDTFFSVEIPILAKKYEKYSQYFRPVI